MLNDPQHLIDEFAADMAHLVERAVDTSGISFDFWPAPHQAKDMPAGKAAVYVFSLCSDSEAPAGPNRVIKVGKVGPNSNPRFRYQHYTSGSARSTLAGAIENNPVLWRFVGYPGRGVEAGAWLRENTDRTNFYFAELAIVGMFEVYVKARSGSVYEGSLSAGA